MTPPTKLFFRSRSGEIEGQMTQHWVSNWPPPAELIVIREKATSNIEVIERNHQAPGTVEYFEKDRHYQVLTFALNEFVRAGAEYVVRRTR